MESIQGKELPYEEWLTDFLADEEQLIFPSNCFPCDEYRDRYLSEINEKSDKEVKNIVRKFLPKTSNYGKDNFMMDFYIQSKMNISELVDSSEYHRRLFQDENAWEGLTWVLDLLPTFPNDCLKGIDSFYLANCQFLPDFTLNGISDATQVISAKYINVEHPQKLYLELTPTEFEWLVAELYDAMGYEIELTKRTHDRGMDVIATKLESGNREKIIIQCKRYSPKVTVKEVRELNGVVASNYSLNGKQATRGILVSSSLFTRDAKKESSENYRIELIDHIELSKLLNRYLGRYWFTKLSQIFWKYKNNKVVLDIPEIK